MSTLTGLQQLDLSSNKLRGVIPNLSSLTELQELYLSDNEFQGPLNWLANLTSCTTITVNNNRLVGPLPRSIGRMTKLNMLVAHNNDLHGSLPVDLFELPNLQGVVLSGNPKLYGMLPTTLSSPSLTGLVIEGCDIVGYLPKKIESNLTTLYLAGNKIKSRGSNSIPRLPTTIQVRIRTKMKSCCDDVPHDSCVPKVNSDHLDATILTHSPRRSMFRLQITYFPVQLVMISSKDSPTSSPSTFDTTMLGALSPRQSVFPKTSPN